MRINFKAFADFKLNGLKEAHIYKITHFTTKVRIFIVIGLLYIPFPRRCIYTKMLVDISIFLHLMAEEHSFKSCDISYMWEMGKMRPLV